jgi:hypothetical protein
MAPATTLSAAVGSKLDCWPYLLFATLCTCQRTPKFKVRLGSTFQSSWKYSECIQFRGRLLSRFTVKVAVETEPDIMAEAMAPVLGMGSRSIATRWCQTA